jgi:branched-chain amino acid transport system substrate-binding protein
MLAQYRSWRQPSGLPLDIWILRFACSVARAGLLFLSIALLGATASRAELIIAAVGSAEPPGNPAAAVRTGVDLAVASIWSGGGADGKAVRVITADDQCSAAGAETAARSIVAAGASIVIGHVCSSAAIAAAPIYADARIIFISVGARNPKFTDERSGATTFRLAGRSDRQASEIASAIMKRYANRKAAILNDTSPQSRDVADAVHRFLTGAGFPVVHRESYTPGEKELTELVRRLKIAGAGIVFIPAQPHDLAIILAQMRAQQLDAHVIGSDMLAVPAVIPAADLAGEALSVMLSWTPKPVGAAAEKVAPLLQLGREARSVALQAYAAVEVWSQALSDQGVNDSAKIAAALSGKEYETVIGRLRFNERGDATIPSYALHVWRNGAWQPRN